LVKRAATPATPVRRNFRNVAPALPVDNFLKGLANDTLNTMRQIVTLQKRIRDVTGFAALLFSALFFVRPEEQEEGTREAIIVALTSAVNEITDLRRQLRDQKQHLKNNLDLLSVT
jgi:hypothetical protein